MAQVPLNENGTADGNPSAFLTGLSGTQPFGYYGNEIVISGIAGKFPESNNIDEFKQNLMNGVDMMTENDKRWPLNLFGLPNRKGTIPEIDKFDAGCFSIAPKQADHMDPSLRMMIELVYEAIVDAGWNPEQLRGKRIACVVSDIFSETMEALTHISADKITGYGLIGCSNNQLANYISFIFDFQGPSYYIDTACSGAMTAFDQCIMNIRNSQCDAAIVGGSSLMLKPQHSLQHHLIKLLSPDGVCKVWDEKADGYGKSEAVVAIFLQKIDDARRQYATVVHCKANTDGFKSEGLSMPSTDRQTQLLKEVYAECNVNPDNVSYIEAHGTGTAAGDPQEMNALTTVFCKSKNRNLPIGAVKSNMGHAELASGLCAIAKVLIAMETNIIPGNLHFNVPNPDIPALIDGSVKVVDKNTPWNGGYVGVNGFGFGGSNVHILLKSNEKKKVIAIGNAAIASRLFLWCGRTESAVNKVLSFMEDNPTEYELYHLLSKSSCQSISTMPFRGYTILGRKCQMKGIQQNMLTEKRPIWYVFSGAGTQWPDMAKDMMKIKPFYESILKLHKYLKPLGLDLLKLITDTDESSNANLDNHTAVSITCVQIALVDTLNVFGIQPDGIIGHSSGEMCAAYADGCLTAEETVLTAYHRSLCLNEANLEHGSMAAVGLSWDKVESRCPVGVVPACHNAQDNVSISGSYDALNTFVAELQSEGIFAKEIACGGIAYHSKIIEPMTDAYRLALQNIIRHPKQRSNKWVSSSVIEAEWGSENARMASPPYFANNLKNPVYFYEATRHIPANAIVVEIAPHALLQAILRRSLDQSIVNVGLIDKNAPDKVDFFLQSMAKLYCNGVNFDIAKLYPDEITFPVGRGVPMISPLIEWDHNQSWFVPNYKMFSDGSETGNGCITEVNISTQDNKDYFLIAHLIDDKIMYPASAHLLQVWKYLAKKNNTDYISTSVLFTNVEFIETTTLTTEVSTKFTLSMLNESGDFEISESGTVVARGKAVIAENSLMSMASRVKQNAIEKSLNRQNDFKISKEDFYKEMRVRGNKVYATFQGVLEINSCGSLGQLLKNDNYVEYLDYHFQFGSFSKPSRSLYLPHRVKSIVINPSQVDSNECAKTAAIYYDSQLNCVSSETVQMVGIEYSALPRQMDVQTVTMEKHIFVPYFDQENSNKTDYHSLPLYEQIEAYLINQHANHPENVDWQSTKNDFVKSYKTSKILKNGQNQAQKQYNKSYLKLQEDVLKVIEINEKELIKLADEVNVYNEAVLRPITDIVFYNIFSSKVKAVQAGASHDMLIMKKTVEFLNKNLEIQIEAILTDSNVQKVNGEIAEEYQKQVTKWDFASQPADKSLNDCHIGIIAHALSHLKNGSDCRQTIANVADIIMFGGFLIIAEQTRDNMATALAHLITTGKKLDQTEDSIEEILKQFEELEIVAKKYDKASLTTIWLCHKIDKNTPWNPIIIHIDENIYDFVDELKNALAHHKDQIYVISNCWQTTNGIIGFMNELRAEACSKKIRYIFDSTRETDVTASNLATIYPDLVKRDLVDNIYCSTVNQWGSYFHFNLKNECETVVNTNHAFVHVGSTGNLSSVKWVESYFTPSTKENANLCQVYYAAVNLRDTMYAYGKLSTDMVTDLRFQEGFCGMEFAGCNETGQRVMGFTKKNAMATHVITDEQDLIWTIPDTWTMEQAATIPVSYALAYYALYFNGHLSNNQSVLIHTGTEGVSQAAISIALSKGCKVFTTVDSNEKQKYLMDKFPSLDNMCFANSADTSFEQHVLENTNGRGVNIVLNNLPGDKLNASLNCLAKNGHFLELGRYSLAENSLGMSALYRNVSIQGSILDDLSKVAIDIKRQIWQHVAEGIQSGVVQPLDATVFDKYSLEVAFREASSNDNKGKILIKVLEEPTEKNGQNVVSINAFARVVCNPEHSYIIMGGAGNFGLELANFLIERGAVNLIITSRSGIKTGYQKLCMKRWQEMGANVKVSNLNACQLDQTHHLIKTANAIAPVGGVFLSAMVVKDALFVHSTAEDFVTVCAPKAVAIKNLDKATRELCPDLKWFVAFSSITCGYGIAGQPSYALGNSVMERVCEERFKEGLPALTVQLGPIADVDWIFEKDGSTVTDVVGTVPQRINYILDVLDHFMCQAQYPIVNTHVLAPKGHMAKSNAKPGNIVDIVAKILGVKDMKSLNPNLTFTELGIDSMMTMEIREMLSKNCSVGLTVKEIRELTFSKLIADFV